MEDSKIRFNFFVVMMILIIILVIFIIFAVVFYLRHQKCADTIAPWCYLDWMCLNASGTPTNMSELTAIGKYGVSNMCAPLTDGSVNENGIQTKDTLSRFEYIDKNGTKKIGYPSNEKDPSDPACANDPTGESCGNYEKGMIYWPACHGGNIG